MDFRRFELRHGPSEERLGAILRKSWRRLGPSWLHLEPELSETCLETILETYLAVFESKKPCEKPPEGHQKTCLSKRTGSAFHVDKWIHAWKDNKRPKKPTDLFTTMEARTIKMSWKSFWIL